MPTFHLILITVHSVRRVTDLEQVVEHCAGSLPHEHDEAAEVDGDADRGEAHDDIPEGKERERRGKVIKEVDGGNFGIMIWKT